MAGEQGGAAMGEAGGVPAPAPVLIVTGPVGVGKSAVAGEVSARLRAAGAAMAHALVDIDALRWCYPSPPGDRFRTALALQNLAAVWANFRAAGARRLVLADVVESRAQLDGVRAAVPGAEIVVVRLRASIETLAARVRERERGAGLAWHLARSAELAELLERAGADDGVVDTDGRTLAEIADEVLRVAGWQ